jgi:predicted transcriptional regulator of viral defense system
MSSQSFDEILYPIASQQAGYFTSAQAKEVGVSRQRLSYHVKMGRLLRIRPGVYRLSLYPASPHEDLFIAWLAAGAQAVISHESALSLYDLSDALPREIHLIVPRTSSRRHPGIRLHTNTLRPEEMAWFSGLPVTNVPRTVADVAASGLAEELVMQAVLQALQRGLTTRKDLLAMAERCDGRVRQLLHRATERVST